MSVSPQNDFRVLRWSHSNGYPKSSGQLTVRLSTVGDVTSPLSERQAMMTTAVRCLVRWRQPKAACQGAKRQSGNAKNAATRETRSISFDAHISAGTAWDLAGWPAVKLKTHNGYKSARFRFTGKHHELCERSVGPCSPAPFHGPVGYGWKGSLSMIIGK